MGEDGALTTACTRPPYRAFVSAVPRAFSVPCSGSSFPQPGGGLYLFDSDATLSGNTVSANTVPHGGGLYLMYSDATLSGNTILSNTAIDQGGGLWLDFSDATLTNNVVHGRPQRQRRRQWALCH